jgi:Photosynthesis system II assembly factor YCF48/Putative zinc-finger
MTNSIDRLLGDALGGRATGDPPTPCPDADIVAAFADDTLTRDERSRVEAHVVRCVRCQAWLSALEKTRPPAPAYPWWRRRAVAWLVPVAAAATAVVIWTNFTRDASVAPSSVPSQTAHSDARPLAPADRREQQHAVGDELRSQPATVARAPTAAQAAAATRKPEPPSSRSESDDFARERALGDNAAAALAPPPFAETAAQAPAGTPLPSRPVTPVIAQQPAAGPMMAQRSGAPAAEARSQNAAPAATPPSLAESLASKARTADQVLAHQEALAADSLIASTDASRRWRIDTNGVAQHSSDDGATWQAMSTGVNVRMTAVASPSPAVCWLVGPRGTVVLSTDEGRTWQRLAFHESVDLVAVRARDGDHAEIVTADGRTFRTSDRGRTWRR